MIQNKDKASSSWETNTLLHLQSYLPMQTGVHIYHKGCTNAVSPTGAANRWLLLPQCLVLSLPHHIPSQSIYLSVNPVYQTALSLSALSMGKEETEGKSTRKHITHKKSLLIYKKTSPDNTSEIAENDEILKN